MFSFWYKIFLCSLSIDIKILFVFSQLVSMLYLLSIGICSLSIGINMYYIDTFLIGIIFDCTPYWYRFCFKKKGKTFFCVFFHPFVDSLFRTKRGRRIIFIGLSFTPLLMIDKKGEKNLSLYAWSLFHVWYWEHVLLLVSRALCNVWYQEPSLCKFWFM